MKLLDERMGIRLKTRTHPVLPTGICPLDDFLLGGFRKDSIVHFYGDPGSGKTTFAMQIAGNVIRQGWRGVWVDCNGGFSLKRFGQLLGDPDLLRSLTYVRPKSFQHQTQVIQQIQHLLDRAAIVVVDPLTHFYRAERYQAASQGYFRELIDTQLGILTGITHLRSILTIVVNYATKDQEGHRVPVTAKGFERVERYRLGFSNLQALGGEGNSLKRQVTIERAPEKFSQNRQLEFTITPTGIALEYPTTEGGTPA